MQEQGTFKINPEILHFMRQSAGMTEEDIARRNTIVNLLEDWDLLKQEKPEMTEKNVASISNIKIIPSKEKSNWTLVSKYTIGNKK